MPAAKPPLPQPDVLTTSFWNACRRRVLEISVCGDCGHRFLPPGPCCPRCWSPRLASQESSGRGRVDSFAVYRRTYHPGMPAPYVVALVELDEGPRLISNIVGCAPEEVAIDRRVEVRFEAADGFSLPRFALGHGKESAKGGNS
ncbi:OB-fold domain-containing protein [Myxococcota bacterium]|nr:OB-fold domain-containing protein [Myxococcota bacterium]MCZ7619860.1 OB-fold domain-containing protein [Myxococcota bacterium]